MARAYTDFWTVLYFHGNPDDQQYVDQVRVVELPQQRV